MKGVPQELRTHLKLSQTFIKQSDIRLMSCTRFEIWHAKSPGVSNLASLINLKAE